MSPISTTTLRARSALVLVAGVFALVAGWLVLPGAANAGPEYLSPRATPTSCDPAYGCETSSTEGPIAPACSLSTLEATPGTKVTATVTNIPVGTEVTLLFDGNPIATETATSDGQGQQARAALRPAGHLSVTAVVQDTSGGAVITFTVPFAAAVGTHTVVFSGPGFSCDATGGAGFKVLAAAITQPPGGSLSNTGITVALYLAVALVLIVGGLQLLRFARARRRRMARRRRSLPRQHVRR
jgi:uncharacterized protein YjeT (DUF2065 family)